MWGAPAGDDLPAFGPRGGQPAHDERDAGGVDIVHRGEVEHYRARVAARPITAGTFAASTDRALVRVGQDRGGGPVDLAGKLDDGGSGEHPSRGLTHAPHVQNLQFAWSARWCAAGRRS